MSHVHNSHQLILLRIEIRLSPNTQARSLFIHKLMHQTLKFKSAVYCHSAASEWGFRFTFRAVFCPTCFATERDTAFHPYILKRHPISDTRKMSRCFGCYSAFPAFSAAVFVSFPFFDLDELVLSMGVRNLPRILAPLNPSLRAVVDTDILLPNGSTYGAKPFLDVWNLSVRHHPRVDSHKHTTGKESSLDSKISVFHHGNDSAHQRLTKRQHTLKWHEIIRHRQTDLTPYNFPRSPLHALLGGFSRLLVRASSSSSDLWENWTIFGKPFLRELLWTLISFL